MFVKTIACTPEHAQREYFEDIGVDLRTEEKCHVALLAAEAVKQAVLLYALRAVTQYMMT